MQRLFHPSLIQQPGPSLPRFVKPLPNRIAYDDVEYLDKKGALTVPDVGLRNELLRSYVEHVHGYMPLLDLRDFLNTIERNDASCHVSLLLFQAVMFAGTASVDMQHLHAAGFQTRKAARKTFYQRARVRLYQPLRRPTTLTQNSASLRLRLRARPDIPSAIASADDLLVRDAGRSERHLALDGCRHKFVAYDWPAQKSCPFEHGCKASTIVEADMVVLLYARSIDSPWDEKTHEDKAGRLRCTDAAIGRL